MSLNSALVLAAIPLLAVLLILGWFALVMQGRNNVRFTLDGLGIKINISTTRDNLANFEKEN